MSSQMVGINALAQPFDQISAQQDRQVFLNCLVTALSHDEIRQLGRMVEEVDLRTDIFSQLPLELSLKVLGHLKLHECIRARRVSKEWLAILKAPHTLDAMFRSWDPHKQIHLHVTGTKLPNIGSLSSTAVSSYKAGNIEAFRTGTASDMMTYFTKFRSDAELRNQISYCDDVVAWVGKNGLTVHWMSLCTGARTAVQVSKRGNTVQHIAISSSMSVCIAQSGDCRISSTRTPRQPYKAQLHLSRAVQELIVKRGLLAILHEPLSVISTEIEVTTWSFEKRKESHFNINLQHIPWNRKEDIKIFVDEVKTSVIFFERSKDQSTVHFTRHKLSGEIEVQGHLEIQDARVRVLSNWEPFQRNAPIDCNGWISVWTFYHFAMRKIFRIQFNLSLDVLRLHTDRLDYPMSPISPSGLFFWKSVIYHWSFEHQKDNPLQLKVTDLDRRTSAISTMGIGVANKYHSHCPQRQSRRSSYSSELYNSIFIGDESFLVNACKHGFTIYSFEKGSGMESKDYKNDKVMDEDGNGYREGQAKAREERKGAWDPNFWKSGIRPTRDHAPTQVRHVDSSESESESDG